MDTIVEGPPEDGAQDLNLMATTTDWNNSASQEIANNTSTLLYIAVEYVKNEFNNQDDQPELSTQPNYNAFNQHVSPLDPNMSSVARYSPVYNEPNENYNPVVIHQLVTTDNAGNTNGEFVNNLAHTTSLDNIPTVLCNGDGREVVNSQYLEIPKQGIDNVNSVQPNSGLHLIPEGEQVKLLITDQTTGMSYTVSTQELLVEPCLEDQQLLDALNPDPLLDTDLLTLDVNSLKTELTDEMMNNPVVNTDPIIVNNYISNLTTNGKTDDIFKIEPRRRRQNEIDAEEQLLSRVYNIIDRPVPSRARATLPESHLVINKIGEEYGVFAKKLISKQTQFGPLEGVLVDKDTQIACPNKLDYYVENSDGIVLKLDVSDECTSNWMSFVRKAENYSEQNIVLSQRGSALYYTATKTIFPKVELKIGYSVSYAEHFKLPYLQAPQLLQWHCYECPQRFETNEELQKHLNVHDETDSSQMKKKSQQKVKKKPAKSKQFEGLECKFCKMIFIQPRTNILRNHLIEKHKFPDAYKFVEPTPVESHFNTFISYKCHNCDKGFNSEALLRLHNLQHESDDSDNEQEVDHICPACQKKFATQQELSSHVSQHAHQEAKIVQIETFKCPICYKIFPVRDRLQKHMIVHGSDDIKPLQCKTCDKRFINNSALTCHIKTHYDGKKVFECPICKEGFDHVLKLKLHVPNHCENNQYTCPHCGKIFKKYSIIRKHIRAFHCERKHTCEHCQKRFPTLDKLRMHLLKHSDHREFLCADCGKQFKRKDKLKEHCKRIHSEERENNAPKSPKANAKHTKKFTPKVEPTDFHRFIYKCHTCLVGFKRRGMLVNHLAKRHPDISPDSVPELNLPILRTTRDYYCQYCEKVYKSSSKRKAHILKNHPGAALPMSNRKQGSSPDAAGLPNPTFSQMVGSITTHPQNCQWCHKQYASKAKLLQHQRKKHAELLAEKNNNSDEKKDNNDANQSSESHDDADPITTDMDDSCLQDQYKITDEDILNTGIEEFNDDDLLSLPNSEETFQQQAGNLDSSNSHLYRLLTLSNGLPPPT